MYATDAANFKAQTDISTTSLYELLAIATKNRKSIFTLRSILTALESVAEVKECCEIEEKLVDNNRF